MKNNEAIIDIPDGTDGAAFKSKRKNNRSNKRWKKRCPNNGIIKTFK